MARKRYKPEEIVAKLRQVGSGLAGPEHDGRNPPDRRERGDVLSSRIQEYLWQGHLRALHMEKAAPNRCHCAANGNIGSARRVGVKPGTH
jgi:hypothetical protein